MAAWGGLLRSHATMTRAMNAQLVAEHGITLSDYDVLIQLANAPASACAVSTSPTPCC